MTCRMTNNLCLVCFKDLILAFKSSKGLENMCLKSLSANSHPMSMVV